jgi:hypothetical protein
MPAGWWAAALDDGGRLCSSSCVAIALGIAPDDVSADTTTPPRSTVETMLIRADELDREARSLRDEAADLSRHASALRLQAMDVNRRLGGKCDGRRQLNLACK